jgi:hypothetical protein
MTNNKNDNIINKKFVLFIIGFILFLFLVVILFTRPSLPWTINLSDKGTIGDAIGGITGPIINLLSVILLYVSFKTQISANTIQRNQLIEEKDFNTKSSNFSSLMTVFQSLKDDYNTLTNKTSNGKDVYGKAAINTFVNYKFRKATTKPQLERIKNSNLIKDLLFVINVYSIILDKIDISNLEEEDRNLILRLVINFYNTKLNFQVEILIKLCTAKECMPDFKSKLEECRNLTKDIMARRIK